MPGNNNLHRNVIFRNDRVPKLPASNFDTGNDERVLWTRLQKECRDAGTGCDVLTIPHNANLSGGQLYTLTSDENTAADARLRSFWEPLSRSISARATPSAATGTDTQGPASAASSSSTRRTSTSPSPSGGGYGQGRLRAELRSCATC